MFSPARRKTDSSMAETDPLPFVPARWIAGVRMGVRSAINLDIRCRPRSILPTPPLLPGVMGGDRSAANGLPELDVEPEVMPVAA